MTTEAWNKPEAKDAPNTARDPKKWARARRAATRKFGTKNSYVKNMWAVRWYNKKRGEWKKSLSDDNDSNKIDWEKVLNEYGKHKLAYKEHMNDVDFMNPYVFTWSATEHMPMPNATVDPNDLETWNQARKRAQGAQAQIIRFEKAFPWIKSVPGRIVTARSLAQMAPLGITSGVLAAALGVNSEDYAQAQETLDSWMARRLVDISLGKSGWIAGMERLRKDAPGFAEQHQTGPVGDDDEKDTNRWGAGEKAGMRLRWDAAHDYMKPHVVRGKWDDLDLDDQAAVMFAHKMSGKNDELESYMKDGSEHDWIVHPWLRPHQQRFYLQGLYQYQKHSENSANDENNRLGPEARQKNLERARQKVARVEQERYEIVTGKRQPKEIVDRYEHDKVQPGTIAAKKIAEGESGDHEGDDIDLESDVQVPQDGQQGPTGGGGEPPMTGQESVDETHSSGGIDQNELYDAMKHAADQRGRAQNRESSQDLWEEWLSWDRRPGETEDHFLSRKRAALQMLQEGGPNPSSWTTVLSNFYDGELTTANGQIEVSNRMRHDFERASSRMAVDKGVISREEEWSSLPFNVKWKYRSKVASGLYRKAAAPPEGTPTRRSRRDVGAGPTGAATGGQTLDVAENPPAEERGQSPLRASTEMEIQRLNNEINNLTRFYVRSKKTKLGAVAAIEAAKVFMRAERLWSRQQKRYSQITESGGELTPRQQQNYEKARAVNNDANVMARAVFGSRYRDEVARAMGRDRNMRMKQQRLRGKRQALAEMAMSLRKLRNGLSKAFVLDLVDNSNKLQSFRKG